MLGDDGHYTTEYDDKHLSSGPAAYRFKQRQAPAIIMEEKEDDEEEDEGLLPIWLRPQSSASVILNIFFCFFHGRACQKVVFFVLLFHRLINSKSRNWHFVV